MNFWECGTPRSTNNAFGILLEPRGSECEYQPRPSKGPRRTRKERALMALETPEQRLERQAKERREKMRKAAERVNPESNIAKSYQTNSEKAPR